MKSSGNLALIENGWRVLFTRTTDLVQKLQLARRELALEAAIEKLNKYHLLILDDLAYVTQDQAETSVLFELISARYEHRSILITANQPFGEWNKIFPDPAMTLAAVDRLVHHATIFELNVESYRQRSALSKKRGRTHFVESMSQGWAGEDQRTRPTGDWMRRRVGPEPPEALVALQELATREILSACGISPGLFDSRAGAASREAFRQLLHAVITPLARIVETELRLKLDPSITLSFDRYGAADIAGRARAFGSLVKGGMDVDKAAGLSGLLSIESD